MDTVTNAWQGLCLPARVYLILALLSVASSIGVPRPAGKKGKPVCSTPRSIVGNILWSLIWVWIISMLCQAGWNKTAWMLAIGLPILVIVLVIAAISGYLYEKSH